MQNILGVILCGGQSKRMGSDKGLLPVAATIWAKFIADTLIALHVPVVFSINETQATAYCQYILPQYLITDSITIPGPLCGLLSVHKKFPDHHILLMACDMLNADSVTISKLLQAFLEEPGFDFYVYGDADFMQPFCGIYTAHGLAEILVKAQEKQLAKFSMQYMLLSANTKKLPIENMAAFSNYNDKLPV